jgi:hypothetical protein
LASPLVPAEAIRSLIYMLHGHRVMLDRDLADLYGVDLKRLNEQIGIGSRTISCSG